MDLIWDKFWMATLIFVVRRIEKTRDTVAEEPLGAGLAGMGVSCILRGGQWMLACAEGALMI